MGGQGRQFDAQGAAAVVAAKRQQSLLRQPQVKVDRLWAQLSLAVVGDDQHVAVARCFEPFQQLADTAIAAAIDLEDRVAVARRLLGIIEWMGRVVVFPEKVGHAIGGADDEESQVPWTTVYQVRRRVESHVDLSQQFGAGQVGPAALHPKPVVGDDHVGRGADFV